MGTNKTTLLMGWNEHRVISISLADDHDDHQNIIG